MAKTSRSGRKWILAFALPGLLSGFGGCAGSKSGMGTAPDSNPPAASFSPMDSKARNFSAPTAMDSLLSAHPITLPTVIPDGVLDTGKLTTLPKPVEKGTANGIFQIQVDALASMDAAQNRKAVLEAKLGVKMEMIFDPPYYKIRFGNFSKRSEAEDKLLELAQKNVQGFILRQ